MPNLVILERVNHPAELITTSVYKRLIIEVNLCIEMHGEEIRIIAWHSPCSSAQHRARFEGKTDRHPKFPPSYPYSIFLADGHV